MNYSLDRFQVDHDARFAGMTPMASGTTLAPLRAQRPPAVRLLLRDSALWILAAVGAYLSFVCVDKFGLGWDARAYWLAWRGEMYTTGPATPNAYLYSPAFSHAIWPIAQVPWPIFAAVFMIASAFTIAWLLKPLGIALALPLWIAASSEFLSGNIFAFLAAAAVAGLRHPSLWTLAALTKITPCLGPIWFASRAEWKKCGVAIAATVAVASTSFAIAPSAWIEWFDFLRSHLGEVGGSVGLPFIPGPMARLPVALILVIWGARTDRIWTLPTAMCLATPVIGPAVITLCAAIPRLRLVQIASRKKPTAAKSQLWGRWGREADSNSGEVSDPLQGSSVG